MEVAIDKNYDNSKVFKNFKRLPHVIFESPVAKDKDFLNKHKGYYKVFNEKAIKESVPSNKAGHKMDIFIYGGVAVFFGVLGPIIFTIEEGGLLSLGSYLLMFIPALFFLKSRTITGENIMLLRILAT